MRRMKPSLLGASCPQSMTSGLGGGAVWPSRPSTLYQVNFWQLARRKLSRRRWLSTHKGRILRDNAGTCLCKLANVRNPVSTNETVLCSFKPTWKNMVSAIGL